MQNITPEQAIEILAQIAAQFRGTLAEHNTIQEAISVIKQAVRNS